MVKLSWILVRRKSNLKNNISINLLMLGLDITS